MLLSATPENGLSTYVPVEQGTVNTTAAQNPSAVVISGLQPVQPQGSLVYETSINNALVSSSDIDIYNLAIDPNQTLGVVVSPSSSSLSLSVSLYSPSGTLLATATSPSPGAAAVLGGVQSSQGGTYQIQVSGGPGEYTIQPVLNAFIDPEVTAARRTTRSLQPRRLTPTRTMSPGRITAPPCWGPSWARQPASEMPWRSAVQARPPSVQAR